MSTLSERFENFVSPEPMSGCHLWTGCSARGGYGQIAIGRKMTLAHRVAWELYRGPIPTWQLVLHKCDVPACVNPVHLFLGTQTENMADKVRKGRQARGARSGSHLHPESRPRGEKHDCSKLTEAEVREIRRRHSERAGTYRGMAAEYGVSTNTICRVLSGRNWGHVQ